MPASSQVNNTTKTIDDSYMSTVNYDYPLRASPRSSNMQKKSSGVQDSNFYTGIVKAIFDNGTHEGRSNNGNISPRSEESFRPEKALDRKKKMYSYVDTVIERSLED